MLPRFHKFKRSNRLKVKSHKFNIDVEVSAYIKQLQVTPTLIVSSVALVVWWTFFRLPAFNVDLQSFKYQLSTPVSFIRFILFVSFHSQKSFAASWMAFIAMLEKIFKNSTQGWTAVYRTTLVGCRARERDLTLILRMITILKENLSLIMLPSTCNGCAVCSQ